MHDTLPTPGTLIADKYRIEELLGRGGMGAVFRARHELMDTHVAIKLLHPEFSYDAGLRERFLREARAAARIRHPNVVQVFDVGVHQGALFMVMELMKGLSFEAVLAEGALPVPRALALLTNAMRGVAEAHAHGIVHRDIKPENIFVVRDGRSVDGVAKVLDFGISKLADDGARKQLTQTGEILGTPEYMSFEHMSGARDLDARTDVYSFGVLLYRALTGVSPFDADSVAAIAVRVATHTPPGPKQLRPELPEVLDRVVMKAMAFQRGDRYQDMNALIDALTQVASTEGYLQAMTRPPQAGPKHTTGADTQAKEGAPQLERETRERISTAGDTGPVAAPQHRWRWAALAMITLACALAVWSWRSGSWSARVRPPALPARTEPAAAVTGAALPSSSDVPEATAPDTGSETGSGVGSDWSAPAPAAAVRPTAPPSSAPSRPRPRLSGAAPAGVSAPTRSPAPTAVEPPAKGRSGRMRADDF